MKDEIIDVTVLVLVLTPVFSNPQYGNIFCYIAYNHCQEIANSINARV